MTVLFNFTKPRLLLLKLLLHIKESWKHTFLISLQPSLFNWNWSDCLRFHLKDERHGYKHPSCSTCNALKPHIRPSQNVLWWETSACVLKHSDSRSDCFFLCWYYLVYYDLKIVPGTVLSRRAEAERWYWFVKSEWEDLGKRMEKKEREHWQHALQNNYLKITSVWKQPGLCLILENIQTSMRFWDIACKTMNIWPAWKYQTSKKCTWLSTNTHFIIHMHNQL